MKTKPDTSTTDIPFASRLGTLERVLAWSRERDYAGHSKHDALNSPLLAALSLNSRIPRLCITQGVMRFPFNIRSALGVPRLRNPKGIGLFAHAWLDMAESLREGAQPTPSADDCVREAEALLEWLVANASPWTPLPDAIRDAFPEAVHTAAGTAPPERDRLKGLGWGYHYPWQDVGFFQPRHFPNRVVSCWIGSAFLRAYEVTGRDRYLLVSDQIADFLLGNPRRLIDTDAELCLSYVPLPDIRCAVMDVSALVSAFCSGLAARSPDAKRSEELRVSADRLMRFVLDKQTEYGAWYYTWPAADSHITHDNYHSGIILDCLAEYATNGGGEDCRNAYRRGLDFYSEQLFLPSGAPKWMNDRVFPHDIHGAASGILTFTRAARYFAAGPDPDAAQAAACNEQARRILAWTLGHLYAGAGHFYYQRGRRWTKRFCLMRWCNAWMCRALAATLCAETSGVRPSGGGDVVEHPS